MVTTLVACTSLTVVYWEVMETKVNSTTIWLFLASELMNWVIQVFIVSYTTHSEAVISDSVFLVMTPCIRLIYKLAAYATHLMLWVAASRLLTMTLMPVSIVSMTIMSIHWTSTTVSVTADILTYLHLITAMWISSWICETMVTMIANYATMNSFVCFLWRFTIVWAMTRILWPLCEAKTIDIMIETSHASVWR